MTLMIIVSLYRIITFDKQEPFLKWHVLSRGLWDCPNAEQPGLASPLDTMEPALSGVGLQSVALAAGFLCFLDTLSLLQGLLLRERHSLWISWGVPLPHRVYCRTTQTINCYQQELQFVRT